MAKAESKRSDTNAPLGFEAKLWAAADALRNNTDAAEYKHVVLGLIFLKYRRGETLFVDARKLGSMVDRTHPELTDEELARIAGTYGYPPDRRQKATQTVLEQAEVLSEMWAVA